MDNLLRRVEEEFKNKAKCVTIESAKMLALYASFIKYLQEENVTKGYIAHLMNQDNVLDYLLQAYNNNRHNFYQDIKKALDNDQILY